MAFGDAVTELVVVDAVAGVRHSGDEACLAGHLTVRTLVCAVQFVTSVGALDESVAARTRLHAPVMPRAVGAPEHVRWACASVAMSFVTSVRAVLVAIANVLHWYAVVVVAEVSAVLAAELSDGARAVVLVREVVAVCVPVTPLPRQRAAAGESRVAGRLPDAPEASVRAVRATVDLVRAIHAVRVAVTHLMKLDAGATRVRHGEDAAHAEELVVGTDAVRRQ